MDIPEIRSVVAGDRRAGLVDIADNHSPRDSFTEYLVDNADHHLRRDSFRVIN